MPRPLRPERVPVQEELHRLDDVDTGTQGVSHGPLTQVPLQVPEEGVPGEGKEEEATPAGSGEP